LQLRLQGDFLFNKIIMRITRKNGWKNLCNKCSKKVSIKIRIKKVTVFDLYFSFGIPGVTLTLFNYSWKFISDDNSK